MIDWFRVFADINRCGVALARIADTLDIPYMRLYRARAGTHDLRHADGERVLAIWCDMTRRGRAQVPMLADLVDEDEAADLADRLAPVPPPRPALADVGPGWRLRAVAIEA